MIIDLYIYDSAFFYVLPHKSIVYIFYLLNSLIIYLKDEAHLLLKSRLIKIIHINSENSVRIIRPL